MPGFLPVHLARTSVFGLGFLGGLGALLGGLLLGFFHRGFGLFGGFRRFLFGLVGLGGFFRLGFLGGLGGFLGGFALRLHRLGLFGLGLSLGRTGHLGFPVHQLHHCHGRFIAGAETVFQDARITAGSRLVVGTEIREQLDHDRVITQARERQTAFGHAILLGERDERLHHAPQLLGLGHGGADGLVAQQRRRHVVHQRFTMRTVAAQLPAGILVTHSLIFQTRTANGFAVVQKHPDISRDPGKREFSSRFLVSWKRHARCFQLLSDGFLEARRRPVFDLHAER